MCSCVGGYKTNITTDVKLPTIDQYIDTLCAPQYLVRTLSDYELPLDTIGQPIYSSGSFGVVIKAVDSSGETFAIKCFTREQWGRREAYLRLQKYLPHSPYLVTLKYLPDEVMISPVDAEYFEKYDILIMEYVDGITLSDKISRAVEMNDTLTLKILSENFDQLAIWLLDQDFAHGDLKPDNIMVLDDLSLKIVDYDGVFLPDMSGEMQREHGTEAFQHPLRSEMPFSKDIDNYSIAIIALTLRAISLDLYLYQKFCVNPSELIISPKEAVAGESKSLEYIEQSNLASSTLIEMVNGGETERGQLIEELNRGHKIDRSALSGVKINDKWGFINYSREFVIEAKYDEIREFTLGIAAVRAGKKWAYVDVQGKVLCPFRYDMAWSAVKVGRGGLAMVRRGDKYGFVGLNGRVAISLKYDYAAQFSSAVAVVACGGKYGYVDSKGRWVVKPKYDFARSIRANNIAEVVLNGKEFSINISTPK